MPGKVGNRLSWPEKGKPVERLGRKAIDLTPGSLDMVAQLPGECTCQRRIISWAV